MSAPEVFPRAQELFLRVADLTPEVRAALLDEACRDAPDLREAVESLLRHDRGPSGGTSELFARGSHLSVREDFAESGTVEREEDDAILHPAPPRAVGSYRILELLGAGGMGLVYLAEQDSPRRRVALKVLRSLASPRALRRLRFEGDVLGRLQHPGIAQVFQTGTFESDGEPEPFIAMELVDGRPLTTYSREEGLGLRARLELFLQVCDAVAHAHRRGIVHRDLKPGNVLVDAGGRARVLDFGLARVLQPDENATRITRAETVVGTLAYMSPEQARSSEHADTRADVYSLGVVLYELVGGRLPYDLEGRSAPEALRVVCEEAPRPLRALGRRLPAELEIIAAKALRKEPDERYAVVDQLADDVRRHLRDEPIIARPPSGLYVLRKFTRRHRAVVGGLAFGFLALVAGLLMALEQRARAVEAARIATENQVQADRFSAFVMHVILNSAARGSAAFDEVLDRLLASTSIAPAYQERFLETLAVRQLASGDTVAARERLLAGRGIALEIYGPEDRRTVRYASLLADADLQEGRTEAAEARLLALVDECARLFGADDPETLAASMALRDVHGATGRGESALALDERILAAHARAGRVREAKEARLTRANTLMNLGRVSEARRVFGDLAGDEEFLESIHPQQRAGIAWGHFFTSIDLERTETLPVAEQDSLLELCRRAVSLGFAAVPHGGVARGYDDQRTHAVIAVMSSFLHTWGREEDLVRLLEEIYGELKRDPGVGQARTQVIGSELADRLARVGRLADALAVYSEIVPFVTPASSPAPLVGYLATLRRAGCTAWADRVAIRARTLLAPDAPDALVFEVHESSSRDAASRGSWSEAVEHLWIATALPGSRSSDEARWAEARALLARALAELHRWSELQPVLDEVLAAHRSTVGARVRAELEAILEICDGEGRLDDCRRIDAWLRE